MLQIGVPESSSSDCGESGCVEVMWDGTYVRVASAYYEPQEWRDFIAGAKRGVFDLPGPVAVEQDCE